MLEYIRLGGPLMYVLIVCSIIALTIFIERLTYLIRTKKEIDKVAEEIDRIKPANLEAMYEKLKEYEDNILAKLLKKVLDEAYLSMDSIKESVQREANKEIPQLEKNLTALGVIYNIAPMLGLLGTVLGLSLTLQDLVSDPDKLLNGIYMSLITTITGLSIAIPTHIAHSYLTSKVNRIVLNLEIKSSNFMEEIKNTQEA